MIKKRTAIPSVGWLFYLVWHHVYTFHIQDTPYHVLPLILSYSVMTATVALIGLWVLPRFYEKRRYFSLIFSVVIIYLLYVIAAFAIEGVLEVQVFSINNQIATLSSFFLPSIQFFIFFCLVGVAYYFAAFAGKKEAEALEMENAFLRAQLNPHFLLNGFNSLAIEARKIDEHLAERMARMGKIMQYNLMKTDKDGKMPLAMEVEHIENKIRFYHERFTTGAFIEFICPPVPENLRIPPMILVTLVENAFKHGEFTKAGKPITIKLAVNGNNIMFTVNNWKREGGPEKTTSVGLNNLRKRLKMFYSKKDYDYIITENDKTYFAELSMTL